MHLQVLLKTQLLVELDDSWLSIQRYDLDLGLAESLHHALHERPAQAYPLPRWVHSDIPDCGREGPVRCCTSDAKQLPFSRPSGLPAASYPYHRVCTLNCLLQLHRVARREAYLHTLGVMHCQALLQCTKVSSAEIGIRRIHIPNGDECPRQHCSAMLWHRNERSLINVLTGQVAHELQKTGALMQWPEYAQSGRTACKLYPKSPKANH
jgi:hypothetical protein